jgi:uncharacterized alkaline shock family protein YloU
VTDHASISSDILAGYAADAAGETDGVAALVPGQLHRHRGVRVDEDEGRVQVELHLAVAWGASIEQVGAEVERRVREYLTRMANIGAADVHVVVDEVAAP